jgi:hypothetical protein
MTRDAFVSELLDCAKRCWGRFWSQLPDDKRLRLSSMESELGDITRELQEGLWALVAEQLDDLGWELEGRCRGCGYRRERRRDPIEVDVLGHRVTFPASYLYCRRCHQGVNPVRRWLGVEHGGVSLGLQRAVTDLTTRMTFGDAVSSVEEHHGQTLDRTKAERMTYQVGEQAKEYLGLRRAKARDAGLSGEGAAEEQLVLTADGGMIPVGELSRPPADEVGAKTPKTPVRNLAQGTRRIAGREARLIAVHPAQSRVKRVVDLHIAPYEDTAYTGERMVAAACEAGLRDKSRIHGVFDMGSWIHTQFEQQFDTYEWSACADIMHVADYLIDAGRVLVGIDEAVPWGMMQKRRLLDGQLERVLTDLEAHECSDACTSEEHPKCRVVIARRYLNNHPSYMRHYAEIRRRDLPVGSGEAESGVRHLIKRRMSIAGAWTEEHADLMLALITVRASGWWDDFWRWRDRRDQQSWHQRQQAPQRPRFRARRAGPLPQLAAQTPARPKHQ